MWMVVHSVKHIFMRNITSYEPKERIIFIIYPDKIPPNGSLMIFIRPGCQAHRHVPFFVRAAPDGKLQYQ